MAANSVTLPTATGAGELMAVDFPLNFLHAEIVRYFQERDAEAATRKSTWIDAVAQSDFADVLQRESGVVRNLIFAQSSAEMRLEAIGQRVGFALVEKVAKDVPRLTNELETMKFICKEFWSAAFGKPVDNLRTNHKVLVTGFSLANDFCFDKGVYIIQDNKFTTVAALSNGLQFLEQSAIFLSMPCGIVRGALANLGLTAVVTADVESLPRVKFNVQLSKIVGNI